MQINHYVIDASFARGTGRPNTNLTALKCSQILQRIIQGEHLCVFNKVLKDEWNTHASPTANRWLTRMFARRKYIFTEVAQNTHLRNLLTKPQLSASSRVEIEKDLHLLELALAHEKIT